MANQYINALTDLWNNAGTTFQGISLNVTNSASAADSKLLRLQIGGTDQFSVSKAGVVTSVGAVKPAANDGAALGASGTAWADVFLASGAVINWDAGDVTLTHSANALAFAGATAGYSFSHAVLPAANDGAALGAAATSWSDLFLATGGLINFANGDAVLTHSAGILTVSTGDLRVTTAGTNAASAVTVGGTQTLTNKTLTLPQINDTSADHQYVFAVSELAADRTVTLPLLAGNDTFVFADFIQTLTNKTLTSPTITGLDASTTAKGLIEIAVQSEMETGTSTVLAVSPGVQHNHPGHPKFWAWVTQSGATPSLTTSYNVTSITDTNTGQLTVTIATDFSSADWCCIATAANGANATILTQNTKAAGSVLIMHNGGSNDPAAGWNVMGLGDQA